MGRGTARAVSIAHATDGLTDAVRRRLPRRLAVRHLEALLDRSTYKLLVVDYFGTLVTRTVPPWYVKLLAGRRLAEQLGLAVAPQRLYDARMQVEAEVCGVARARGLDPSFRLDELAPRLFEKLEELNGASALPPIGDFTTSMIRAEVDAELLVQRVDHDVVRVLRQWSRRAELVLMSDYYLPPPHFDCFLKRHSLDDVFDQILVSCAHGRTKKSGALYRVLIDQPDVDPSTVLVIGDDPIADGRRPREAGLAAYVVPRRTWERRADAGIEEVARDVERHLDELMRPDDETDLFPAMALTLYVFVRRLHARLRTDGVREAFFLAREGQFLSRLFSIYEEETQGPDSTRIEARYLMTSRRATFLPSAPPRPDAEEYERDRVDQRAALLEYLQQQAGLTAGGTLPIVDVGWKGTTQDQLARAVASESARVVGYYLGLLLSSAPVPADTKIGILFHNRPRRSVSLEVFTQFKSMFELLLAADHGSVVGYRRTDEGVVPVLDDSPHEPLEYARYIAPVQDRIARRFRRIARELARAPFDDDDLLDLAARYHARMVYRPTRAEIRYFRQLPVYNVGQRLEQGKRQESKRWRRALWTVNNLMTPRRLVRGGGWPPLQFQSAGMGWLRFPYGWYKIRVQRARARQARAPRDVAKDRP
jgi:FMN phosphatase YigB (HAD superfamily)